MKNRKLLTVALVLVATLGVLSVLPAGAQTSGSYWQFTAKFLCGEMIVDQAFTLSTADEDERPVTNGRYRTAINFHNASFFKSISKTSIHKKALLLYPPLPAQGQQTARPEEPQRAGPFFNPPENVPPDGGFEIDCPDIRDVLLQNKPGTTANEENLNRDEPFIKGYVVIVVSSYAAPDVVAAYTSHAYAETFIASTTGEHESECEPGDTDTCHLVRGHSEQILNITPRRISTSD